MPFVKLDCGMLDSTLWADRESREIFITALLMAEPRELREPMQAIQINSLTDDDFIVPPGWYGFVPAAGPGLYRRAGTEQDEGLTALTKLSRPEDQSRTPEHEGRRMVRVDGGFIILNYDKYRQKDHTAAERSRRYRERKKGDASRVSSATSRVAGRGVTQAEAEAEAEADTKKKTKGAKAPAKSKSVKKFVKPSVNEAQNYFNEKGDYPGEGQKFVDYYNSNGWKVGGRGSMKDWQAAINGWISRMDQRIKELPRKNKPLLEIIANEYGYETPNR